MKIILLSMLMLIPFVSIAQADTVEFCQGQSTNSIFWQKSVCSGAVTCEIFEPNISIVEFTEIDYFLALSQTSGYCLSDETFLLNPVLYHVTVTDSDFDYTVYDESATSLEFLPNILLYKDIPYDVKITTSWKTYDETSKYSQFVEDEYGNLVSVTPFDYTLEHEVKVKVKDMG